MKLECGKRKRLKKEREQLERKAKQQWHKFFAIWPVQVAKEDCRWFETVERQLLVTEFRDNFWGMSFVNEREHWIYRAIDK